MVTRRLYVAVAGNSKASTMNILLTMLNVIYCLIEIILSQLFTNFYTFTHSLNYVYFFFQNNSNLMDLNCCSFV